MTRSDGKQVAFESDRDTSDDLEVFLRSADGTGVTNVTRNPARDLSPDWFLSTTPAPR